MGALVLGRAALAAVLAGVLLAPWHGMESGFSGLAAWPAGEAAPLVALLANGTRWWLWPAVILLLAPAPALLAGRVPGRLLAWCGAAAIALVFVQGTAIGLRGLAWPVLAPLLGETGPQAALGWGAAILLAGAFAMLSAGLAAQGRFGGDAFIAFLVAGSAGLLMLFVFLPLATILAAAVMEDGRVSPGALAMRLSAPEAWSLACVATSQGCGVVWNTLVLASLTAVISTLIGLAFALLAARGNVRAQIGRRVGA